MLPDPTWNHTSQPYPAGQSVHAIVRRIAEARPGARALVHGQAEVTYGELDRAADGCAAGLAAAGVRGGDLVPVLLPKGTTLVASMLGVLKLGAAYALIDQAWPDQRIRDVVSELGARLVIAAPPEAARAGLSGWHPPEPATMACPANFRPAAVPGSAPCCVFFTSGTTGRPKGVLTPHRALVRLFRPGTFACFTADSVVPLAAPQPWDGFALEVWSVLLNGGTSLIVDEPYLSAAALRDGIASHRVDTAWITSSLFNMIVDEDLASFLGMRQVMIGGERLSVPHVRRFLARHPRITLINGYGPVESTVFATTHRITTTDCERRDGIPIGRPVPDTQVHVLDGERLCAVDQPGELCLAGHGLALGYLNDAALTAGKFQHVLFGGESVRVYRTGDIGWWDAGGLLHYGGRLDRQVKIRGHRVEPAEVERQIESRPEVRRCVVLARPGRAGTPEGLAAFCVPEAGGDQLPGLRESLRGLLPSYQVPDTVLSVTAYPLTSNGKLDERALLALTAPARATGPHPGEAVRDATTSLVASVFAAVLGRPDVPADADFTALGGTSLGAGRVCARLSAELDRPLPVSRLLASPTARAFARWLDQTKGAGRMPAAVPTAAPPVNVPLSTTQADFLAAHLLEPDNLAGHCLGTWLIEGDLDAAALASAIEDVHGWHEPLRAAYSAGREPTARATGIPAPPLVILPAAASETEAVELLRAELRGPLALGDGQVWRVALVPLAGARASVFGYVVHHISFDGWSEAVLAADLGAAYDARRLGARAARPPRPSLADAWSIRQEYLCQADLGSQRRWLEQELRGVPPLGYPSPCGGSSLGFGAFREHCYAEPEMVAETIEPTEAALLDAVAAAAGVTRFAVLLSGYGRVLAELTGQRDFGVGIPVAQRFDRRLARAVGCHVNVVCVRLRGEALAEGTPALAHTGRLAARALLAQDLGLGEVVRLVNPPRSGRTPLFQHLFAGQDNALPRLELDGTRTQFIRQPYLGLPAEIQTDVWPRSEGGLRLVVSFRPEVVKIRFASDLAKRFADFVRTAGTATLFGDK